MIISGYREQAEEYLALPTYYDGEMKGQIRNY